MADKFRSFCGVVYPDSTSYVCDDVLKNLVCFKKFAYCLHDQDVNDDGELKKAHIHWVGTGDARKVKTVSNLLGVAEHDIEICKSFQSQIQYLIHKNDPDKFQYDVDSISTNIVDIKSRFFRDVSEGVLVRDLASAKLSMSWYDLIQYSIENESYDVLRRNLGLIKLVWEEDVRDQWKDGYDNGGMV